MGNEKMFRMDRLIRFADCDPAGIVYYPRYFDMFVTLLEDWLAQALDINYAECIRDRQLGLPTVKLECEFSNICRMGEILSLFLQVEQLGTSSLTFAIRGAVGDRDILNARAVLVATSLRDYRSVPIPEDLRAKAQNHLMAPAAPTP